MTYLNLKKKKFYNTFVIKKRKITVSRSIRGTKGGRNYVFFHNIKLDKNFNQNLIEIVYVKGDFLVSSYIPKHY